MTKKFALLAGIIAAASLAQASSIGINGTGVNVSGGQDQSYTITTDSTGEISAPAQAFVVTAFPLGWGSISGVTWIAPEADQSNTTHPTGSITGTGDTYQTTFTLPSGFTSPTLSISFLVDDGVTIYLNGNNDFTAFGSNYASVGSTTITSGFVTGTNTLTFVVSNSPGGPTGLDVAVSGSFNPTVAPEPGTTALLGSGLIGIALMAWRRKRAVR